MRSVFRTALATTALVVASTYSIANDNAPLPFDARHLLLAGASGDGQQVAKAGTDIAAGVASDYVQRQFLNFIPTAEVRLRLSDKYDLAGSALVLIPVLESEDHSNLFFTQGSVSRFDSRTTVNIGLGYRRLAMDKKLLMGINGFYDQEFPIRHQRASIGGELRTTAAEINFNYYVALTGWKDGQGIFEERAMDGWDIEVGAPLPYMPRVKAFYSRFQWQAQTGNFEENGWKAALEGEIYPGVIIEVGRRHFEHSPNETFTTLRLNLVDLLLNSARKKPFFAEQPYKLASMEDHRYDKVRRENLIRKEKRVLGNFIVTASGF